MSEEFDAEKIEGTWAWEYNLHWKAFNACIEQMNRLGHENKLDHIKLREDVLWDMIRRHEEEKKERRNKMGSEFDSIYPIRIEETKVYDSEGNILKCSKCEKEAIGSIKGKDYSFHFCQDHSIVSNFSYRFIYRPPKEKK
jgi:hypothetical protein